MNVLVLVENYPDLKGERALTYVHTRNIYYLQEGIQVDVLNFSATENYTINGIQVITYDHYKNERHKYDYLIIHAANIRHHYAFLKKYGDNFERYIFFYHGHEVLKINQAYPKPFPYVKESKIKHVMQDIYDSYKLYIWRHYIPKIIDKSFFVFVSNWMLEQFEQWVGISRNALKGKYMITYNCVGEIFEAETYCPNPSPKYDFITIRTNFDVSKYSVDIVNKLANNTQNGRFLVVGKGNLFNVIGKAPNIVWDNRTLNHKEITEVLNQARFALMPTRTDAQGLMMCEMAAFGIPVITSDIPVCHEVFDGFENAFYIDNETTLDLNRFLDMKNRVLKDDRFYERKTVSKEIELIFNREDKQ